MTADLDRETRSGRVTLRYWASARAAAGTDSDALEVTGPVSLAELVEPGACGARGLIALRRRALLLLGDGGRPPRHHRRSRLGTWSSPAPPWSSCRRSPAADHTGLRASSEKSGDRESFRPVVGPHVSTGVWVLVVAVVAALAFGLFRALTDGRFRGTHRVHGAEPRSRRADRRRAGAEPAPESLLAGTPWADRAGRARDAAAVLLGVLRTVPGDAQGPRRCRAASAGRRTHRGRRGAPPGRRTPPRDPAHARPRWCSTSAAHEVTRADRRPHEAAGARSARAEAGPRCLAVERGGDSVSAMWSSCPHAETHFSAPASRCLRLTHDLDHADQAPRSGQLPHALVAVSNVLTGRTAPTSLRSIDTSVD